MTEEHKNNLESLAYEIVCSGLQKEPLQSLYDYIDDNFELKEQVKVEPEVIVNFAEVYKIIDNMIIQHKEGSERHKEHSVIYNRHKNKIDVLERLKSKLVKSKISE